MGCGAGIIISPAIAWKWSGSEALYAINANMNPIRYKRPLSRASNFYGALAPDRMAGGGIDRSD